MVVNKNVDITFSMYYIYFRRRLC